jgi:hypothetical protein
MSPSSDRRPRRVGWFRLYRGIPWIVTAVIAVAIVAGVVITLLPERDGNDPRADRSPGPPGDCEPVERPKNMGRRELTLGEEPPGEYGSNPPTSGWYIPRPATPAFYGSALSPQVLVANLAQGDVVVWYSGMSPDEAWELEALQEVFGGQLIVVPGDQLKLKDPVVITAWGALQRCDGINADAITRFVRRFAQEAPQKEEA